MLEINKSKKLIFYIANSSVVLTSKSMTLKKEDKIFSFK